MPTLSSENQSWLDKRFQETDANGVYVAHQPIYGFRQQPCEPGLISRYTITYHIMQALSRLQFESLLDVGGAEGYKAALARKLFGCKVKSVDLSEEACKRAKGIFDVDGEVVDTIIFLLLMALSILSFLPKPSSMFKNTKLQHVNCCV